MIEKSIETAWDTIGDIQKEMKANSDVYIVRYEYFCVLFANAFSVYFSVFISVSIRVQNYRFAIPNVLSRNTAYNRVPITF